MDENKDFNVNDSDTNYFETAENEIPEGAEYDVFAENTASYVNRAKAETMNRDYLKRIYNQDMDFLNKDIRMTRTQYNRDLLEIEESFEKQKRTFKRHLIFHIVLTFVLLFASVYFFREWNFFMELFHKYGGRGYWMTTGFFGTMGYGCVFIGLFQGVFFGIGHKRKIKELEKIKQKSISTLEERKKEFMMLGQYDASR